MKSLLMKQNNLPALVSGSITATSNNDMANFLNITFANVLNYSISGLTGDFPDITNDGCPSDFLCTKDEGYYLLSILDITKANKHDDISARMLKETAVSITPKVTKLFNISIMLGKLPDEWKISRVVPIPKAGK